jgi:hypothetical protein
MRKVRVRIVVEAVEPDDMERQAYPTSLTWDVEYASTGSNPRFYAGQLQNAIRLAAQEAVDNLGPFVVSGGVES